MKISFRLPSTNSLRFCQTGEGISFYPPLHGIILAIFEDAKNGRKKRRAVKSSSFHKRYSSLFWKTIMGVFSLAFLDDQPISYHSL